MHLEVIKKYSLTSKQVKTKNEVISDLPVIVCPLDVTVGSYLVIQKHTNESFVFMECYTGFPLLIFVEILLIFFYLFLGILIYHHCK